jgi:hypothetical protein
MPKVECKLGAAETHVAGTTYSFQRDEYGRFVAQVERHEDVACLIAVEHYRIVPDVPEAAEDAPKKKGRGKRTEPSADGGDDDGSQRDVQTVTSADVGEIDATAFGLNAGSVDPNPSGPAGGADVTQP